MLIEEEINQILIHAIDLLPVQSARIMRLILSGYENKEIAKVMGVSVNTIKTLKYAAIRKLREYSIRMITSLISHESVFYIGTNI